MNTKDSIRKAVAFLLLVVFTLSTTPKSFFHDAFAKHKDVPTSHHHEKGIPCIHPQSFHCGFDELVVTTPYLFVTVQSSLVEEIFFADHSTAILRFHFQHYLFHAESRGPPVS